MDKHQTRKYKLEDLILDSFNKHRNHPAKTLVSMYKGNYYRFILSGFFYLIKHSPAWLMPIVIANIVNVVMYQADNPMKIIQDNALLIIFLVILNIPMNYLHIHFSSRAIRKVEAALRSALIRKLQQLSMSFHKEFQSGRLQSKVIRDVEAVQTLSSQLFVGLLNISINITIALFITIVNNRLIFVFFLLTIPVASLTIVFFRTRIKEQNHRFRKEIELTSAKVMDMEEMIPVTRAHALESIEVKRMRELVTNVSEEGYRLDIIQANFGSVSWAIFQIFQVGCLVFSGWLVLQSKIQAGDIVLYQSYFTSIVTQVSALIMLLPTITKGMESVSSIGEVLTEHDVEDNSGKVVLDGVVGNYQLNEVFFTYPGTSKTVLNGLNIDVKQGETIAFVGGSGAGKSTVMNLLIGFNHVDKGGIWIDGNNLNDINLRSYRKYLAVVPQTTLLFSGSIRENITYGLSEVTEQELMEAIKAANLETLISELPKGLDTLVGEHGNKLSGGQKQRISIARALIRNPRVIIFDEATSALDSISEELILEALQNLTKNRTTFVVAHRLSTIRQAHKICVLEHGVAAEFGTYEELMNLKGIFYHMKALQT
jgi:ATP-binding cassette, subfamily B, bacterial